jgi:hypothetical protein
MDGRDRSIHANCLCLIGSCEVGDSALQICPAALRLRGMSTGQRMLFLLDTCSV